MVFNRYTIQGLLEELHGDILICLACHQALHKELKCVSCDGNCTSMFELKEHINKAVTQIAHILIIQELCLVLRTLRKLGPRKQVLQCFPILFNSQPNAHQNQVLVVLKLLVTSTSLTTC